MLRFSRHIRLVIEPSVLAARRQASFGSGGGAAPGASRRNSFRPFSMEDEAQLVSVLTTKPRHVARHIRQSMQSSRKQALQFRNSVTFLMIQLQSKLQKQEINAGDASSIVEAVMKECVDLRQSDMAHLLFRASLRFRKYGLKLTPRCIKYLFDSYKAGARSLMAALADELRTDNDLRAIVMAAQVYGGKPDDAMAMLRSIRPDDVATEDIVGVVEAFGALGQYEPQEAIFSECLALAVAGSLPRVRFNDVASTVLSCIRGDWVRLKRLFQESVLVHKEACLPLSDAAVGYVLRNRIYAFSTLAEIYQAEADLKKDLGLESLGLAAETTLIARCSELIARGQSAGDEIMLVKVQHLRAVIEANLDAASKDEAPSGEAVDEIDQQYIFSMIKGFGILGKQEDMRAAFDLLRNNGAIKDHRVYDELLRWYAYANNVKEVIALKEEMTKANVYHSTATFQSLFRVLDKHYPRMVEKYYAELLERQIPLDASLYAGLIRVFSELGDMQQVQQLHQECKQRAQNGQQYLMTPAVTVQLIRAYQHHDASACDFIIADAKNCGHLTHDMVQAEVIQFYCSQNRTEDMVQLVQNLPRKSSHVFRVLLREASRSNDRPRFDALMAELRGSGIRLTDRLFGVIISALGHFHDAPAISRVVGEARDSDAIRHAQFFSDAAVAFARVGDWASVDDCWERLLKSNISITMNAYNRFMDLYMSNGLLDRVQQVLDVMIKTVPPNPITATTVIDMLGKMGRLSEMEALLEEMMKSQNATPTLVTFHQVMNAYAKAGDIHKLEVVRHKVQELGLIENHVTYNILAEGYGRAKRLEHLQDLVAERRAKGIAMEEFGYVILLNIYARAKLAEDVRALVTEMHADANLTLSCRLLGTIASAFGSVGDTAAVEQYVREMLQRPDRTQRDVETIYLLYSRLRDTRRLQQLLDDTALPKTPLVYNVSISSFAKAGEHSKVALLLQEMEAKSMSLSRNTAVTLSSLLLKAGKLQLAQAVLDMNYHGKTLSARQQQPATVPEPAATETTPVDDADALMLQRHEEDIQTEIGKVTASSTASRAEEEHLV